MSRYNRDENADMLFRAVLSLETVEQCYDFFEDLCTKVELREMSRRFEVARLIREGEKSAKRTFDTDKGKSRKYKIKTKKKLIFSAFLLLNHPTFIFISYMSHASI